VVKKRDAGSRSPDPVMVTLSGYAGRPPATRAALRSAERTFRRGLSRRSVVAPTRIASTFARTASTRSKSAASESNSGSGPLSSMWPSTDIAAESST
jgi:hypothetical protein